jgi:hypothetical protein
MKHANWMVVAALVAFSGLASAQKMASNARIVSDVPFGFTVSNRAVPAGEWTVQTATLDANTLSIRNSDAKVSLFSNSSQSEGKQASANYTLVFNRYGDRYFLAGIKLEGSKITYHLAPSKVEAELSARSTSGPEEILVAAK